jgi:hypothetical protein
MGARKPHGFVATSASPSASERSSKFPQSSDRVRGNRRGRIGDGHLRRTCITSRFGDRFLSRADVVCLADGGFRPSDNVIIPCPGPALQDTASCEERLV